MRSPVILLSEVYKMSRNYGACHRHSLRLLDFHLHLFVHLRTHGKHNSVAHYTFIQLVVLCSLTLMIIPHITDQTS
eukprot:g62708.t1